MSASEEPEVTGPLESPELEASTRKWMWAGLALMAVFIAIFPIYRLYEPTARAEAHEEQLGFFADLGADLYQGDCAGCHGVEGIGALGPAIGSSEFLEMVTDDQIVQLIGLGVPGTEMSAYSIDNGGPLTSQEIRAIAVYLRSLEEDAESNPLWQTPLAAEDLTGEDLFDLACSRCHGVDRTGIEDLGPDISASSVTMEESDEFLAGRIREGRNAMPRFGRVLTEGQIQALVGYLRGGVATAPTTAPTTTVPTDDTTSEPTDTTTTTEPDAGDDGVLTLGKEIFNVTAGGQGCASCHGADGRGSANGPNIIGVSKSSIVTALGGGVPDMAGFGLTREEIDAVYEYLQTLSE